MPNSPNDDEDAPNRPPEHAGSDHEAMEDAFDVDEALPKTIQDLINLIDLYRLSDRILLFRQYCQECGGRETPNHACPKR